MSKGNLENLLGGTFLVLPDYNAEVDAVDHGPAFLQVDSAEKVFEKTFDGEQLLKLKKYAPPYKALSGRFDPFEYDRMKTSAGTWSVLINKPVITFQDACEHAMELCRFWGEEDKELAVIAERREQQQIKREAAEQTEIMVEGTKAFAVEQARLAWKEAVRQRDEILKQWNDYVTAKRTEYRQLRDN